jgi:hypothetical protein
VTAREELGASLHRLRGGIHDDQLLAKFDGAVDAGDVAKAMEVTLASLEKSVRKLEAQQEEIAKGAARRRSWTMGRGA